MESKKKWYQSKTIWFAVLTGVAGVITAVQSQYPELGYLAGAVSAINIALRLMTSNPIQ